MSKEITLNKVATQALMPEQLVHYVKSISDSRPRVIGQCLVYFREDVAIVVGFSSDGDPRSMSQGTLGQTLDNLRKRDDLERVIVHAPFAPNSAPKWAKVGQDNFWQIRLPFKPKRKKGLMVELFGKDPTPTMEVTKEIWGAEHDALAELFIMQQPLNASSMMTMQNLDKYLADNPGTGLFCVRDKKKQLQGCLVADFTSEHTAFHMVFFSIPNPPRAVEDSLVKALIDEATAQGKKRVNVGMGHNPKIKEYKNLWGAEPFLPFVETVWEVGDSGKAQALYYEREMARRKEAEKNSSPVKKLVKWIGL